MTARSLGVTLVCSAGGIGSAGRVVLALRLAGITGMTAGGSVAERDAPLRHFAPDDARFRELAALAGELDLARRAARVEARVDTSDGWMEILLHVASDEGERTTHLHLMSTGFEGEDAAALRRFFALLLAMADARDRSVWFDLTGRER